jgi:hypothetical protein
MDSLLKCYFSFILCLFASLSNGQNEIYIKLSSGVSYTYASFLSGSKVELEGELYTSNYYMQSSYSTNWEKQTNLSFSENFARKYHYALEVEAQVFKNIGISSGFEYGARLFRIFLDEGQYGNFLLVTRSFRTFSLPVSFHYNIYLHDRFYLQPTAGLHFNYTTSTSVSRNRYIVKNPKSFYPLLSFGCNFSYRAFNNLSIYTGIQYRQGFYNIIDDKFQIDLIAPGVGGIGWQYVDVISYGSHFSMYAGIKVPLSFKLSNSKNNLEKVPFFERELTDIQEIIVDTSKIKLCVSDDQTIDGDSIAIEYKGEIIEPAIALVGKELCFEIEVSKNSPNYLVIHALNEGRIKPNTLMVKIIDGKNEKIFNLKSDLAKSGVINIIVKP